MISLLFWKGIGLNLNGVIDVGLPKRVLKNVDFKTDRKSARISDNQYQPMENGNGFDLPPIIRGSKEFALLGQPS
jgi:hypothetical protein